MKRLLFLSSLILFVLGMAFAQQTTDSASLNLSGTVGDFVSVSVTPEPAASGLSLSMNQPSLLQVGTVVETSNVPYEVTATSTNSFEFSNGTETVPYTFYYDGSAVASSGDTVSSGSQAAGISRPVSVTYSAADINNPTGAYSDTVTFSISSTN